MPHQAISGVILAGGQGRRMGRVDKGLQLLDQKPLVLHVLERFAPQVDELLINANQNPETYAAFGPQVITDLIPDFAGPLAGLQAALSKARHPLIATAPCDSPFLPENLVPRLLEALTASNADLAVARTGDQVHPVFCLCRRSLLPHLTAFLAGGGRKFALWFATLQVVEVHFDDNVEAFRNINTQDELAQFTK